MVIDRFYFSNGESAGSLEEFLEKLKHLDDGCFYNHVNEEKNDFVGWLRYCVKDKSLAKKIEKLKDRGEITEAIYKKIRTPLRLKKNIIKQIKEAILNE